MPSVATLTTRRGNGKSTDKIPNTNQTPSQIAPTPIDSTPKPCFFFTLPVELRNTIYRFIALSRLDCCSHPRLWRPLGVDGGIFRIGYFDRNTVLPLLLTSRRVHDEVAAILYGENTFAFHISGLAEGPISFLEWLAPRYVRLLRKVYVRTGYGVDTYGFRTDGVVQCRPYVDHKDSVESVADARALAVSVALMRQAWPLKYRVFINRVATVSYPVGESADFLRNDRVNDWPASSFHLWKMFVTDVGIGMPKIEFRRVDWGSPCVKNLMPDGTRVTVP